MVDEVTLAAPSAKDLYTQTTPGTAATYTCKIDGGAKMIRDKAGREQIASVQVWIPNHIAGLDPTWTITLPARFSPRTPPIIMVDTFTDETTIGHHTVVYCGFSARASL